MKQKIFRILFFIIIISIYSSCSKSDDDTIIVENSTATVNIDGNTGILKENDISGNENCNDIFLELSANSTSQMKGYRLIFHLSKTGELNKISYWEYNNSNILLFLTPNFNPTSEWNISNYSYDSINGLLEFDFNGNVFLEENINVKRNISGKVKVLNFVSTPCQIGITSLDYNSNNFKLHSFGIVLTSFNNSPNQIHRFYSNNGYKIYINLSNDLWNLNESEILFDSSSINDNVDFYKYIGPLVADQLQWINNNDWKRYNTSGRIIIDNKFIENGEKIITGRININVKDNGETIFILNGIKFKTKSLI